MRLTVTSSERWHWCLVGTYDCLLINIKVATSHMPAPMFSHLSSYMCWRFPRRKGSSVRAASWRSESSLTSRAESSLGHLPSSTCRNVIVWNTSALFSQSQKTFKILSSLWPLHTTPSQFWAWGPVQPLRLCALLHTSPEILLLSVSFLPLLSSNVK